MLKKASLGFKKRFYLGLSFFGRLFLEKMDFEKSPKNGQISPKSEGVNLNFLTILDHFWVFFKRRKKPSLGLKKRFQLILRFIGRILLEKMHGVYSPGRITRFPSKKLLYVLKIVFSFVWASLDVYFSRKWSVKKVPKMAKFLQKLNGLTLTFWRFWIIFEIF